MMAHWLAMTPLAPVSSKPIAGTTIRQVASTRVLACHAGSPDTRSVSRRMVSVGAMVAAGLEIGAGHANAAARRAPPPPPPPGQEKKDPGLSGLQAKVLASKKRKEALKQSIAKLREKGKTTTQQQQPSSSVPE